MGNLVPIFAAGVGALATVAVQLLISRGEPADLKRLAAINSILGTMPADQAGWLDLANARTHLALRVAQGVVAPPRTIRALRWIGWMSAIFGALLFAGSIALFSVLTPAGQASAVAWMQVGLYTLFLAPLILYVSWLWQELRGLPTSIRETVEAARVRISARHAKRS
ncbi:hypothetical protein ACWKWN_03295 [Microbacterium trichothecenolyticum]